MISCEKAALICNKAQYREASFIDKMKLRFHLFMCKNCTKSTARNIEFTRICENANLQALSSKQKDEMKKALQNKD